MKHFLFILFIISIFKVYAYSDRIAMDDPAIKIFCPPTISCTSEIIPTCSSKNDIDGYWEKTDGAYGAIYSFYHAETIQHSGFNRTRHVVCNYSYQYGPDGPGEHKEISVTARQELNLDPSFDAESLWQVTGEARTDCFNISTLACPLIEAPNEILIICEISGGLCGHYLKKDRIEWYYANEILRPNDYSLRTSCNNLHECQINYIVKVLADNEIYYYDVGAIFIELKNMKINRVVQDPGSPIKIYKHPTLNTIIISQEAQRENTTED
jgi:hypothetical protein